MMRTYSQILTMRTHTHPYSRILHTMRTHTHHAIPILPNNRRQVVGLLTLVVINVVL